MKKSLLFLAGFSLAVASVGVMAQQAGGFTGSRGAQQQAGFSGPSQQGVTTVANARRLRDDTKVLLQGQIVSHKYGDIYLFQDASGSVDVDIDDEDWHGQQIGPNDRVEIRGEVDRGVRSFKIDVDSIRKL
ncbi:MAG: NirD/YgiW/YdeI family stress tolerance protein [Pseudomonadota bacterium]|nr:NirD/YgiW/YdeI family stress tolerance protein [Pseudomonadota bacterium]